MSELQVLVIDDQFARDGVERTLFLKRTQLRDARAANDRSGEVLGKAVFTSGQKTVQRGVVNSYDVIRAAVQDAPEGGWALVLVDAHFDSGPLGNDALPEGREGDQSFGQIVSARLAQEFNGLPIVMFTGKSERELQLGSGPYLSKVGVTARDMRIALLRHGALSAEQRRSLLQLPQGVIAESAAMLRVLCDALVHAASNASIFIRGETGTGKEVLAKYIHAMSPRHSQRFESVNMAAIPGELAEAELFGSEKGAFTGAYKTTTGRIERADKGTFFLDEIGDMPSGLQAKMLRVLQEREIQPLGGGQTRILDVRFISATHRDVEYLVATGAFREDLLYRIRDVELNVPPLRDRADDIPPMAKAFLEDAMAESGKVGMSFSDDAIDALTEYTFRGNARELRNIVRRAVSQGGNYRLLRATDLQLREGGDPAAVQSKPQPPMRRAAGAKRTISQVEEFLRDTVIDAQDEDLCGAKPRLEQAFQELMRHVLGAALERCREPRSGRLQRQPAMQFFTGDNSIKGKGPSRIINALLGRPQDTPVTEADVEALVTSWRNSSRSSEVDP